MSEKILEIRTDKIYSQAEYTSLITDNGNLTIITQQKGDMFIRNFHEHEISADSITGFSYESESHGRKANIDLYLVDYNDIKGSLMKSGLNSIAGIWECFHLELKQSNIAAHLEVYTDIGEDRLMTKKDILNKAIISADLAEFAINTFRANFDSDPVTGIQHHLFKNVVEFYSFLTFMNQYQKTLSLDDHSTSKDLRGYVTKVMMDIYGESDFDFEEYKQRIDGLTDDLRNINTAWSKTREGKTADDKLD